MRYNTALKISPNKGENIVHNVWKLKLIKNIKIALSLLFIVHTHQIVAMDNQPSFREQAIKKLPKLHDQKPQCEFNFKKSLLTYHDNQYVEQCIRLLGGISTEFLAHEPAKKQKIEASHHVSMGEWHISTDPRKNLSAGRVFQNVVIAMQHQGSELAAMYHYYEKEDPNFDRLFAFIRQIKATCQDNSIILSHLKVSLVSSFISANLIAIKDILESNAFTIHMIHARPRVWLDRKRVVGRDETFIPSHRLIFVNPSGLEIHHHHHDDPGIYKPTNNSGNNEREYDLLDCCMM